MTAEPPLTPAIDEPTDGLVHPHRLRTRFLVARVPGNALMQAEGSAPKGLAQWSRTGLLP